MGSIVIDLASRAEYAAPFYAIWEMQRRGREELPTTSKALGLVRVRGQLAAVLSGPLRDCSVGLEVSDPKLARLLKDWTQRDALAVALTQRNVVYSMDHACIEVDEHRSQSSGPVWFTLRASAVYELAFDASEWEKKLAAEQPSRERKLYAYGATVLPPPSSKTPVARRRRPSRT